LNDSQKLARIILHFLYLRSHHRTVFSWFNIIEKDKLGWINVSDLRGSENEGALRYGINAIPDNILIDKNGIIVARYIEPQKLRKTLEQNLNGIK